MELLLRYPGWKDRALTLSYDDGTEQDAWLIDIMEQAGVKGTFNLNSGLFRPEDRPRSQTAFCRRMTQREAKALYSRPHVEAAAHGRLHQHMELLDNAQATFEFASDKAALEALFGTILCGGAYAYGTYTQRTTEILASCGLHYCRTVQSTHRFDLPEDFLTWHPTCHHGDPAMEELTERFLTEPVKFQPRLFYLWGHTYEFERDNSWDIMERFLEKMAKNDQIWYATNGEIFRYIRAFQRLESSSDGKLLHNPTAQMLWFRAGGEDRKISPGEVLHFD